GKAEMFGFDCWTGSLEIRRRVGVLFEKVAFYDHLSGLDHLQLMAKIKGVPDPLGASKAVLKLVELENEAQHRRIGSYSAGMRQRIGLAHALLGTPELVILDEPTSNLDPLGRAHVLEMVNKLKKEGFSFLISSHILPELERVCDHVILMNRGKAVRQGTLTQLLSEVASSEAFNIKVQPIGSIAELLKQEKSVKEIAILEDHLLVIAKNADLFKQRLPLIVAQANASLEEVKVVGTDLESLFKVAVKGGA
ncbi:MAG: ABC transporter ATP-binding protein, partial [Candidatus Bathyarchaeia archaeon]